MEYVINDRLRLIVNNCKNESLRCIHLQDDEKDICFLICINEKAQAIKDIIQKCSSFKMSFKDFYKVFEYLEI